MLRGVPSEQKRFADVEGHTVCPGALGTTNFMPPNLRSAERICSTLGRDQCDIFSARPAAL